MAIAVVGVRRVRFGNGELGNLPEELAFWGIKKPVVITDPGIKKTGLIEKLLQVLEKEKIPSAVFDGVEPEPPIEVVDAGVAFAKAQKCDGVIGFGGGSSLDSAKAIAAMLEQEGPARKYLGSNLISGKKRPLIQLPTTAGTGSEVTMAAIFFDSVQKLKIGMASPYLAADTAIVDPELSYGMPPFVTACGGLDALIHAVESYLSVKATPYTDVYALKSIELISANLREAFAAGAPKAREAMSLGSMLAGVSMGNAGGAAVHAFTYPVGGRHHVTHAVAIAMFIKPVLAFNIAGNPEKFANIAAAMGIDTRGLSKTAAAAKAVEAIEQLTSDLGLNKKMRDIGVTKAEIPELAKEVLGVTRLLNNNPRSITLEDALKIYEEAF